MISYNKVNARMRTEQIFYCSISVLASEYLYNYAVKLIHAIRETCSANYYKTHSYKFDCTIIARNLYLFIQTY